MEKDRNTKIIAIVALLVAVVSLSVGFASWSRELTISSEANVYPENTFSVRFSTSNLEFDDEGDISVTKNPENIQAGTPSIDNEGSIPTITGLSASFTEPGQSVEYTFYVHPNEYDAFLRNISYASVTEDSYKDCTAITPADTNEDTVDAACESISLEVEVIGEENVTTTTIGTKNNITGNKVAKDGFGTVKITIAYAENGEKADGDFKVEFGDVSLVYSTIDGEISS